MLWVRPSLARKSSASATVTSISSPSATTAE